MKQTIFGRAPRNLESGIQADSFSPVVGPARAAINGTGGADRLNGTAGNDFFDMSQGGADRLTMRAGDDVAVFGAAFDARDRVDGGTGFDVLQLQGQYGQIEITGTTVQGIEQLTFLVGFAYSVTLVADLLADDQVFSITGTDATRAITVDASTVIGDVGFFGAGGSDIVTTGSGDDFFRYRIGGNDVYDGGTGFNRLSLFGTPGGVTFDLGLTTAQVVGNGSVAVSNIDDISGTTAADTIRGNANDNWILSSGGADVLHGLAGDDFFQLGIGADGMAPVGAFVDGGRDFDIIDMFANGTANGGATVSLADRGLQDTGQGTYTIRNVERITGTQHADTFTGDSKNNSLFGNSGADHLIGGGGDDFLFGDAFFGHTLINGFDGPVTFFANETAIFADTIEGGAGIDFLNGGGGDDILIGGADNDFFTGGAGNDLFVYTSIRDSLTTAADLINDFLAGDRIDLSAIDADTTIARNQAFHLGATPGRAGDIVVEYDAVANRTIVDLYVDGDATPDATIQLAGQIALGDADFVF